MYPSTSLFIAVGQLAIAILVMFSYPLQVHPCRNCLDKVFHAGHVLPQKTNDDEDSEEIEIEDEHGGSPDMSTLKHTLLTVAIISSGFTIAYFVDDLQMGTSSIRFWRRIYALTRVIIDSAVLRGVHWFHHYFVYITRLILLEGMCS